MGHPNELILLQVLHNHQLLRQAGLHNPAIQVLQDKVPAELVVDPAKLRL